MAESVVELIFKGIDQASDVADKVGENIGGALSNISAFGDKIADIAAPLAEIADKILQTEFAVTALGATLVGAGVRAAGEFNDTLSFTATLFDATAPQFAKFKSDILDYASSSTQSLDKINAALQNAIGQGIEWTDALGLLGEAEKLAVAQGASLDDATSLLAGTLNAYGLEISDAARLSDLFSITIRDGKVSVEELSAQLSNVLPLAAAAGIGFDQIGAAIAVLTAQGFQAGPAITGVKQIIEGIIKPTQQAADYAQSLGLSFNATTLESKGLQGILVDVQKATGGNVDAFAKLFTTSEGLSSALALAGNGADKFAEELQKMRNETGVTEAAFKKMADNIGLGSQRIQNAIQVAFINLGTPLLDELGTIQAGIAKIFANIGNEFEAGGALRPITEALESWGVDIGKVIASIAENLPAAFESVDVSNLIEAYRDLGEEVAGLFKSFFGDIDLTTVDGLSEAIQKVIDSLETLTRISAGVVGAFDPMAEAAGAAVNEFNKLEESSKVEFGEFLGAARSIILAGPEIAGALLLIGRTAVDIGTVVNGAFGGVQVAINALQVAFDGAVIGVVGIAKSIAIAALAFAELDAWMNRNSENSGEYEKRISEINGSLKELDIISDAAASNLQRNAEELEQGWNKATGEAAEKTDSFKATLDNAQKSVSDFADKTKKASEETRESVKAYDGILAKLSEIKPVADVAADALSNIGDAQKNIIVNGDIKINDEPIKNLKKTWDENGNPVFEAIGSGAVKATGAFKAVGDSAKESGKGIDEATKKGNEFVIEMEKIASNERIKNIEAIVSLNVEQLKADVERVKATFASIDTTIKSTGDLLGGLFGNLVSTDDIFKERKIESQIELENKRRQEALNIQKKMAEAEIERINAQTRSLDRGDSILTIQADGLEPHLEAFMWEILKKIRARVNAEFAEFLLGAA